ncbi:hypothetical protein DLD77_08040 [Chitinophaga alhagiae]|uniref:Transposase IS200-like domain-containing protein n=1 Tax=Chitinophaga alhagiae TaxID=2203219 RepID=A0ABM6WCF3_9BACT|nr:hypothetical protein [Chitinophaga alhagiae]AWO01648.1 hypothetical protein DLD77_08040 [Chitinophaga alhagiae]
MEFFSAYCVKGRHLLEEDIHKQIVVDSLAFMVENKRIWLYGFVILPGEFHLLWQRQPAWELKNLRQMLLKFTAHQIKHRLKAINRRELETYRSPLRDRQFQFWERHADALPVSIAQAAAEKLQQMHEAPVAGGLCRQPEAYRFSSAAFYAQAAIRQEKNETGSFAPVHAGEGQAAAAGHPSPEPALNGLLRHYQQYFPP